MGLNVTELNITAIVAGGFLYMIYGGIYYSILLGKTKDNENTGPFKYVFSVFVAFFSSCLVALLVQAVGTHRAASGVTIGLIIGIVITLVYYKNTLFGLMTKRSFIIATGDHLVIFTLLGLLHGIMN